MIREMLSALTDPLAGSYLAGWVLITTGVIINTPMVILLGAVLSLFALVTGGVFAYAE